MPVDVTTELLIAAPIDTVARFAADPSNGPSWYSNITSVEWLTPQPAQLGSKVAFVAQFLGRTLRYTYEIVELVPDQRLVMRTSEGPFPMKTTYTWTPRGDATLMTLRNHGEPNGLLAGGGAIHRSSDASREPEGSGTPCRGEHQRVTGSARRVHPVFPFSQR